MSSAAVVPVGDRLAELTAQLGAVDASSQMPMNGWGQWPSPSWHPQFQQFQNQAAGGPGWGQCFGGPCGTDVPQALPQPPQLQGPASCAMVTPLHMNEPAQQASNSGRRRRGGGGGKIVPKRTSNREARAALEPPGHHQGGGGRIVPVSAPASADNSPGSPVLPRVPSNGPAIGAKAKVPPVPVVNNAPSNGPRRIDPNDGQPRNYYEFMCKYAVGADFKKAEELWEKAGQLSLSANAVIVPLSQQKQQKSENAFEDELGALSDEDGPPPLQDELPPPLVDDGGAFDFDASEDEGTPDGSMGSTELSNSGERTPWDSGCEAIVQQVLAA